MNKPEIIDHQISKDGTEKLLVGFSDGNMVESVLMKHDYGNSACISSQVGCNMGCVFCESGKLKKLRDLSAEEMYMQVKALSDLSCKDPDAPSAEAGNSEHLSRIVIMGTGEPFDNCDEVINFCNRISDEKSEIFIEPRHITVSTCGILPGILKFAETDKRFNLAVSLHATNNELRDRIMPINRKYPLEELMPAAAYFSDKTKRRVAFEYILLDGVNDSTASAEELALTLSHYSSMFYVNLIPFNEINEPDASYSSSKKESALAFYDVLMKQGVKATLRKERGSDISAACGQLMSKRS